MSKPDWLTVSTAHEASGTPRRTIQYAISKGDLKARKLPGATGAYLIERAELERWLDSRGDRALA